MSTPYSHNQPTFSVSVPSTPTPTPTTQFIASQPAALASGSRGGKPSQRGAPTGAKRGRKPKNPASATSSPRIQQAYFQPQTPTPSGSSTQYTGNHYQPQLNWGLPTSPSATPAPGAAQPSGQAAGSSSSGAGAAGQPPMAGLTPPGSATGSTSDTKPVALDMLNSQLLQAAGGAGGEAHASMPPPPPILQGRPAPEDEAEVDDELLPGMADEDYSAQLSFQTQSKDNLKVLMDNFSPEQYDRFEAYRRHALPKQAVRKVIQQTLGQQVSMPVAQIIAGFSKVFVGEMVEKARMVQARRGETGPLSPDHLREAYRMYQEETGRVGAARPLRSKRLFVR